MGRDTPESLQHVDTSGLLWTQCPKLSIPAQLDYGDFSSEKEMCDYIELNHKVFCEDILEERFVSYDREWHVGLPIKRGPRRLHVDFRFETDKSKNILVECKNAKSSYIEVRNAISQLMSYVVSAESEGIKIDRCVFVSNRYDHVVTMMIRRYNLEIEYILFKRNQMMKLVN